MASCDINDVQNVGELSTSTFPVSKEDGEAVLAGVYQNLNQVCADPQNINLGISQSRNLVKCIQLDIHRHARTLSIQVWASVSTTWLSTLTSS